MYLWHPKNGLVQQHNMKYCSKPIKSIFNKCYSYLQCFIILENIGNQLNLYHCFQCNLHLYWLFLE